MKLNYKKILDSYSLDELIVLALVLSIFVSVYFTIAALVMTLAYLIMQNRISAIFASVRRAYWILAFCAVSFVVSVLYKNVNGMLIAAAMLVIFLIAMYVRSVMTRALFEKIINLSIAASIFCFAVAIIQQFIHWGHNYRADSTFFNANYYATIIEFVILFCVYRLFTDTSLKMKVYYSSVMLINIFGLYLCDCRTAFIVLAFSVMVMMIFMRKFKELFIFLGVGFAAMVSLYFIPELFPRGKQLDGDIGIRILIWKTSVKGILESPLFGQGGGTYGNIFARFNGHPAPHAHNLLLDPLLNFGIVGFAMLLKYLKTNVTSIFQMYGSKQDHEKFCLSAALIACVVFHGMFDITVFGLQTGLLLVVFLGVGGIPESHTAAYGMNAYQTLLTMREGQKASFLSFLNIKKP